MNPLLEKNLISTKEASSLSGYNADYLARLCRSGKIVGTRLGRAWLVSQESLEAFVKQQEVKKQELSSTLSQIRGTEYHNYVPNNAINKSDVTFDNGTSNGLEKTSDLTTYTTFQKRAFAVLASFVVMLIGVYGAQAQVIGQVGNDALATALSVSYGFDTILSNGIQSAESSASNTIAVAQSQPASTIFPKISNQEAAVSGAKNIVDTLAPLALTQHTDAAEVSPNTPVLPNASVASTSLSLAFANTQSTATQVSLPTSVGDAALSLGVTLRDAVASMPNVLATNEVGAAVSFSVFSDEILQAYTDGVYAYVNNAQVVPAVLIQHAYVAGSRIADATSAVPQVAVAAFTTGINDWVAATPNVAATIVSQQVAVGSAINAVSDTAVSDEEIGAETAGTAAYTHVAAAHKTLSEAPAAVAYADAATQNTLLGLAGTASQQTAQLPSVIASTSLAAAIVPASAANTGEQIAFFTYEVIHGLFSDISNEIALLTTGKHADLAVEPTSYAIPNATAPQTGYTIPVTNFATTTNTYGNTIQNITNETIVENAGTSTSGVSQVYVDNSIADLRELLQTQLVNQIDSFAQNRTFAGGGATTEDVTEESGGGTTLASSSDISIDGVTANTGEFETLGVTGSTTLNNLEATATSTFDGDVYITGTLHVNNISGFIGGGAGTSVAAFFAATSSTATSTFAGNVTVAGNTVLGNTSISNLTGTNATFTNSTTTNATTTNLFSLASIFSNSTTTNAFDQYLVATQATTTDSYSTVAQAATGIFNNFFATLATISNLTTTNSTSTNATSTNLYATNGSFSNLLATIANFTSEIVGSLTATNAVITNGTTTNATSTNLFATNVKGTNILGTNATTTNATTTNLFATNSVATFSTSTDGYISQLTSDNAFLTQATSSDFFSSVANFGSLSIGNLNGFLKATNGVVSTSLVNLTTDISGTLPVANGGTGSTTLTGLLKGNGTSGVATAIPGIDYLAPSSLTATYPIQYSGNNFSLAFGTSTSNTWGGTQTFTNTPILGALSGILYGNSGALSSVATGTVASGAGISVTGGQSIIGSGLTITNTGVTSVAGTPGQINVSGSTGAITISLPSSVSFTNASTSNISANTLAVGGTATTTISSSGVVTAPSEVVTGNANVGSLTIGSLNGILRATAGVVGTSLVNLASDISGVLPVANGGTGWAAIQTGAIPYGNGTGSLSTTTAATNGQVLGYLNGIPTWVATTTFSNGLSFSGGNVTNTGLLSLIQNGGGTAQTGAITLATSTLTTNGQTHGIAITNTGGVFTFTPTISGTLAVSGGGTGSTTLTGILKGNGTGSLLSAIADTDYQAPITLTTTGTSGAATFIGNTLNIPQYNGTTYTGTYPIQVSGSVISTAFSTTTTNVFSSLNTFNGGATIANSLTLSGVTGITQCLQVSSSGVVSGTGSACGTGSGGVTSVSQTYGASQAGAITFSTTTDSFNGLTFNQNITNSAGNFTFSNLVSGTLGLGGGGTGTTTGGVTNGVEYYNGSILTNNANLTFNGTTLTANILALTNALTVANGGTGLGTAPSYGNILVGNASGGYTLTATSSLGFTNGTVTSVNASGGTTGLSFSGGPITSSGTLTLAGTLGIGNGGTGTTTGGVTNGVEYYNGSTLTNGTGLTFSGSHLGIGSTSPFANLSIGGLNGQASTSPLFAISSSTPLVGGTYVSISGNGTLNVSGRAIDPTVVGYTQGAGANLAAANPNDVWVSGHYAYVVGRSPGSFTVFDVTNPANPVYISSIMGSVPKANFIAVSGNYAYVTLSQTAGGIAVVDISNPSNPTVVTDYDGPTGTPFSSPSGIIISGNYAYISNNGNGTDSVVNISNPSKPQLVATLTIPGASSLDTGMYIQGNYLYQTDEAAHTLDIVDISNPANPTLVTSYQGPVPGTSLNTAHTVWVSGKDAYVGTINSFAVIDVSNPSSPQWVTSTEGPVPGTSLAGVNQIWVSGHYAYVTATNNNTFDVIDISNPTNPTWVAQTSGTTAAPLSTPRNMFVVGNYAYIANFNLPSNLGSLAVIDVGGSTIANAQIGTLAADTLQIDGLGYFNNDLNVRGGLQVGQGILSNGGGTFTIASSTSLAGRSALSGYIVDTNAGTIENSVMVGRDTFAGTTPAAGLGAGLGFSLGVDGTTATTTGQIASVLTTIGSAAPAAALTFSVKNGVGALTEAMRIAANGNVGIRSTTPWALLSINPNGITGPAFVIGSSTATDLIVTSGGNVGVGTTTPGSLLSIGTSNGINFSTATSTFSTTGGINITSGCYAINGNCATLSSFGGTLGVANGGTGISTAPTYGQILVGNTSGGYTLTATSTLGFQSALTFQYPLVNNAGTVSTAFGTTTSNTFAGTQTFTNPIAVGSGTGTSTFNGNISIAGSIVPTVDNTYSLGSPLDEYKDVYIGPGSLYVNGQEVVHTDVGDDVVESASVNEALILKTSGTANIEFNPSGTGIIQAQGPIQISAGEPFTTSNGTAVNFTDGSADGNITVSGNAITATNLNGGISITPAGNGGTYVTNGNFGIGTTSPGSILSVQGVANFGTATSTFFSTGGINIQNGCFADNGTCLTVNTIGGTLAVANGGTGSTTLTGLLKGNGTGAVQTAIAGTDYLAPSSLTGTYPIVYNANNFSLAFGTSTSNTFGGTQTFTNSPVFSSVGAGVVNSTASGAIYNTATSSVTNGTGITISGNAAVIGAGGLTITNTGVTSIAGTANQITASASTGGVTLSLPSQLAIQNASTTNLSASGYVNTGSLTVGTLNGLLYGNNGVVAAATVNSPLTYTTGVLSIQQASGSQAGYLSAADFTTFSSKISSTSLSAVYPLAYNSATGVFSTAFSTTTANTFSALNTFNAGLTTGGTVTLGSGNGVFYGVNGVVNSSATSTVTNGTGITISGNAAVVGTGGLTITNTGVTSNVAGTGIGVSGATGAVTITNTGVTSITGTANQITTSASTGGVTLSLPSQLNLTNASSTNITASGYANVGSLTVGTLNGLLYGNNGVVAAATVSSPLTYSAGTLGIQQASGSQAGYLSAADWNTFANKVSSTSLSAVYPLAYNSATGVFSTAFSTTTNNTYSGTQTFTNSPVISTLGLGTVNSSANGTLYSSATSSVTNGTGISFTGTPGALIGGSALTITNTGVTSNVAGTGIGVSGATGAVTITNNGVLSLAQSSGSAQTGALTLATSTALSFNGLTIGQTITNTGGTFTFTPTFSGTLGVAGGGTGSTTLGGILLGNGTGSVQTLTVGSGLVFSGGTLSTSGAGITAIGPTGQTQTGGTQILATTTSTFNGLTEGLTITAAGNTQTFQPTLSGTLGVAGGGTGVNTFTSGLVFGNGTNPLTSVATSTVTNGTGITISGNAAVVGTGGLTITNTGVTSNIAGTGISVSGATGAVTITNTGVTSITGTANQITASASTGGVTLSLPSQLNLTNASTTNITASGYANVGSLTVGTLNGLLYGNNGVVAAATVNSPLTYTTGSLSIQQASGSQAGYLSAADFATFANKISSTSLSAVYPLAYNSSTGVFSTAFSTTTNNTYSGTQTFTNSPIFSTLGAGVVNSTAGRTVYNTATSSVTSGTGISFTGTPGALIGGTALTITNTGVTSNVAGTGIGVSGATGAVTITNNGLLSLTQNGGGTAQTGAITFATSSQSFNGRTEGINITNTGTTFTFTPNISGTLNVTGGGTGLSSVGDGQIIFGGIGGGNTLVALATSTGGSILETSLTTGRPVWVATSTLGFITSAIQNIGPAGQLQNGPTVTFASTTSTFNGLTVANTITGAGNTLTFTPSLSGTLAVGGGGTGATSFTNGLVFGNGTNALTSVSTSTVTNGTGITISGNAAVVGTGGLTITNTGVTSNAAGTGISVSGATGAVTITNTGVTSVTGTANQITTSASTGGITLSLPNQLAIQNASTTNLSANTAAFGGTGTTTISSTGALTTPSLTVGTLNGLLYGNNGVVAAATVSSPLTYSTGVLGIQQASASQAGYLSAADFATFSNKISSTSLSAVYPLAYNSSTGVFTTAFSTTTTNVYSGSNTFNGGLTISTLNGVLYGNSGVVASAATSTVSTGAGISVSGSAALVGTGGLTITNTGVTSLTGSANQITASASTGAVTLSIPAQFNIQNASTTNFSANTLAVGGIGTTTISVSGVLKTPSFVSVGNANVGSLTIGSLSGFLKATGGVVGVSQVNLNSDVFNVLPITSGGTGTSTAPTLGQVLVGDASGNYELEATSSLGFLSAAITGIGPAGQVQNGPSINIASSSSSFNGLTVANTITGSGNTLTFSPSLSGILNVTGGGTGSTTLTGLLKGNRTGSIATAIGDTDYQKPITLTTTGTSGAATFSGDTLNIPQYSGTIYTGTYPVQVSGSTISLAFGTTTSNTWGGVQTFTNSPIFTSLGAGVVNATSAGGIYNTATSSVSSGTGISFTGTPGALIGGTALTITNTGVTSNVAGTGISVSGATGAVTITNNGLLSLTQNGGGTAQTGALTFATSTLTVNGQTHGLAITNSGTTFTFTPTLSGTLSTAGGGTGSTTLGGILIGNGTGAVQSVTIGSGLTLTGTTLSTNGSGITAIGPTGQTQTGGTQILATTTSTFNGLTSGLTITASGNTQTFQPTLSGTLNVAGGGTGITSLASGALTYGSGGTTLNTLAAGTNGQILAIVNGSPAYVATTTFSGGLTYSGGNVTNTGVLSVTGTTNQITANNTAGAVTLSIPSLFSIQNASTTQLTISNGLLAFSANSNVIVPQGVNGALNFATSTTATPILSLASLAGTASGAVGIGTSTPWGKLSVEMGPLNPAFVVSNNGSSTPSLIVTGVNQNGNVGISTSSPYGQLSITNLGSNPGLVVSNAANTATQFEVSSGGNVGIGTTSPGANLAVAGNDLISGNEYIGGTGVIMGGLGVGVANPSAEFQVNNTTAGQTAATISGVAGQLVVDLNGGGANYIKGTSTFFTTSTGTHYGAINSNGIAIGTGNPLNGLDVNGAGAIGTYASTNAAPTNGLIVSGEVGLGTPSPDAALTLAAGSTLDSLGALTVQSNTTNSLTLDTGTTGTINLGSNANAKTINVGGSGGNTIQIGNTQTAGSISLGSAMTTGTITIGGAVAQTGTITIDQSTGTNILNLGTGTGATTLNIGSGATTAKILNIGNGAGLANSINIGGSGANNIALGNIQTAGTIAIGGAINSGTITIGGAVAQTGTITIGQSTATNILNLGIGTGAATINLGTGATSAKTINIGTAAAIANIISIGGTGSKVGIGTTTPTAALTVAGAICAAKTTAGTAACATTAGLVEGDSSNFTGGFDYAEEYPTSDSTIGAGDVISFDPSNPEDIMRASSQIAPFLGVVSTAPGVTLGSESTANRAVALAGRVPVTVSAENGPINVGDRLMLSTTQPGVAIKAVHSGQTIGVALDSFTSASSTSATGSITVFLSPEYWFAPSDLSIDATSGDVTIGDVTTKSTRNLSVVGNITANTYEESGAGAAFKSTFGGFGLGSSTAASVLSSDGTGVDLYKLATFTLTNVQALATQTAALTTQTTTLGTQVADLETRVSALEAGATAGLQNATTTSPTSGLLSATTTQLASALEGVGVLLQDGIAQFNTLVVRDLVFSKDSDGTSAAGSGTVLAGNTVVEISSDHMLATSQVSITPTSPITGNWYVSQKADGSFRVTLSQAQTTDFTFDYLIVQTQGQIATTTPTGYVGNPFSWISALFGNSTTTNTPTTPTTTPNPTTPTTPTASSTPSTTSANGITVTLNGGAAMSLNQGDIWMDPGATATDASSTNISSSLVVTGTVDTNTPGIYTLTYTATDAAGNTGSASRVVTVSSGVTATGASSTAPVTPSTPAPTAASTGGSSSSTSGSGNASTSTTAPAGSSDSSGSTSSAASSAPATPTPTPTPATPTPAAPAASAPAPAAATPVATTDSSTSSGS